MAGGHDAAHPVVEGGVGGGVGGGDVQRSPGDSAEGLVVEHVEEDTHPLAHAVEIDGLPEVVVVEQRPAPGIGGGQAQAAGAGGQVDGGHKREADDLGVVVVPAPGGAGAGVEEHVVAQVGAGGRVPARHLQGRLLPGAEEGRLRLDAESALGVAAQVAAHPRQVGMDRQAQGPQVVGGTDPGEQQQLGGADGPAREQDLTGVDALRAGGTADLHGRGAPPFDEDPPGRGVATDLQVRARPNLGGQVAEGGAPADAAGVVQGQGADAGGVRVVVVGAVGLAPVAQGVVEGLLLGGAGLVTEAVHGDRPLGAVEVAVEVGVGLDPLQAGQDLLPGPLRVAGGGPAVVVLRDAAQEDLGVDGAGAAHQTAPGDVHVRVGVGGARPVAPAEAGVVAEGPGPDARLAVGPPHLRGQVLRVGEVGARLQQQHPAAGLGEARGEHAAGGAGPHQNGVPAHGAVLTASTTSRRLSPVW